MVHWIPVVHSGDSISNLTKYAFNMAPSAGSLNQPDLRVLPPNGTAGLPDIFKDANNGLVVHFLRRKVPGGLDYIPEERGQEKIYDKWRTIPPHSPVPVAPMTPPAKSKFLSGQVYASDADAAKPALQNIALLFVQNGLAIIRPCSRPLPEMDTTPGDFLNQLTTAEIEAKRLLCGGWAANE